MRLDLFLVQSRNITRNRAQFLLSEGLVWVNGKVVTKASFSIDESEIIVIQDDKRVHFVSRSAIKLDSFLDEIKLDVLNMTCLDIGASTGGFTQVLLMRGALGITSVDVGTSQLHVSLRSDSRVISQENTDIRDFQPTHPFDLIVGDISFISLTKLIDSILALASPDTEIILLYKPQFEVGREHLRKTGVPKSDVIVVRKFAEFQDFLITKGVKIKKISPSTIAGEAGNREYLMWIWKI